MLGSMRTAVYPGSFDPITNGHVDLIRRAAKVFDQVIVAVAHNEQKKPLFSTTERLSLVVRSLRHLRLPNVRVDAFSTLLVDYVEQCGAHVVLRGLRAISDFEFEFQLALMNRSLNEGVETLFMMPKDTYSYLSSRIVKEIARMGGDVSAFVPGCVRLALKRKLERNRVRS